MSNNTAIQMKVDNINRRLDGMINRTKSLRGYLNRVVYRQYQEAQIKRWNTENASEGTPWKKLNPEYASYKRKKYASYPYAGSRLLVATGTLLKSVVGQDPRYHRKIVTNYGITIMTTLEYAPQVAAIRPFMKWSKQTKREIMGGIRRFILTGKQ